MTIGDLARFTWSRPASLAAIACLSWSVSASAETAIRFSLDRKIDGPSAPFFVAIDKGYFKAEGLDVSIEAGNGDPSEAIKRIAGRGYDMGVADVNLLIKYRDANPRTPVKGLFVVFDKPPYAVVARKSRGIAAPMDLAGKKLGAPAADPSFAQWPLFATINGIDAAKVLIENVGLPVRVPMLAAGEVDAITAPSFTAYVDLKDDGVPPDDLVVLLMADYGLKLYGDVIAASPSFIYENPDAVRGFLRAYVKAVQETLRDPAGAIESVLRRAEGARKDTELERLRMAIEENIATPAAKANGFGAIDPERFAAAIDQLALTYRFKAKSRAFDAFDPAFLPEAREIAPLSR